MSPHILLPPKGSFANTQCRAFYVISLSTFTTSFTTQHHIHMHIFHHLSHIIIYHHEHDHELEPCLERIHTVGGKQRQRQKQRRYNKKKRKEKQQNSYTPKKKQSQKKTPLRTIVISSPPRPALFQLASKMRT